MQTTITNSGYRLLSEVINVSPPGIWISRLRNHARNHNLRLVDVAQHVIDGTLATAALDPPRPSRHP